jgi:hypothetical protein
MIMPNLYSIDIKLYATAYIIADNEEEAREIVENYRNNAMEVPTTADDWEVPINGETFNADMPEFSLSPAMTIVGPEEGHYLELVQEFADEDADTNPKYERAARAAGWIIGDEAGWDASLIIHKSNADDRAGKEYGGTWRDVCEAEGIKVEE